MRPLRSGRQATTGDFGTNTGDIDANVALPYRPAHSNALLYLVPEPGMTVSGR